MPTGQLSASIWVMGSIPGLQGIESRSSTAVLRGKIGTNPLGYDELGVLRTSDGSGSLQEQLRQHRWSKMTTKHQAQPSILLVLLLPQDGQSRLSWTFVSEIKLDITHDLSHACGSRALHKVRRALLFRRASTHAESKKLTWATEQDSLGKARPYLPHPPKEGYIVLLETVWSVFPGLAYFIKSSAPVSFSTAQEVGHQMS